MEDKINNKTRIVHSNEPRAIYPDVSGGKAMLTSNSASEIDVQTLEHSTVSWRAIFAGAFISLLAYFIMMALGVAIGGASLKGIIAGGGDATGLGIGSGIWLIVSVLGALFVGSYLASRVSGMITSRVGGVQGLVVTSIFFAFMISQIGSGMAMLGSGLGSVIGAVGGSASDMSKNPQVRDTIQSSLAGLNLKSPPEDVAQGVATRLLRGQDEQAKSYLANQAGISTVEADRRIAEFKDDVQQTAKDVGTTASKVASIAGWTIFGMLLLGSLAAYFGGRTGVRANLRRPLSKSDVRSIDNAKAA